MNKEDVVELASANSTFYKKLYKGYDLRVFKKLPIISKSMLLDSLQSSNIDFGVDKIEGAVFARVTSGTSSQAAIFYRSEKEIERSAERFANTAFYLNEKKKDRVCIINNYTLSYTFAKHFSKAGCMVLLGNPYDLQTTAMTIIETKCNAIRTTPPVALKIANMLQLLGYDDIDKWLLAGSVLSSPVRKKLNELYPKAKIIQQYGMAETAISLHQCKHTIESNIYHIFPDDFFYEFITEKGKYAQEGEVGRLVITKLTSENPLIRYDTADLFRVGGICECGMREYFMVGRASDEIKVKGITVFRERIDSGIKEIKKYITGDYQITVEEVEDSGLIKSKFILYVELLPEYKDRDVLATLAQTFSDNFEISEDYTWSEGVGLGLFCPMEVVNKKLIGEKTKVVYDRRFGGKNENNRNNGISAGVGSTGRVLNSRGHDK